MCGAEFTAKRKDAIFCSSTCRSRGNRLTTGPGPHIKLWEEASLAGDVIVPAPEKEKKGCCEQCITFESGIHWCGDKGCNCWETPEEQRKSIDEHQRNCSHPKEEAYLSRCLSCGRIQMAKMAGVYLKTRGCEKHRGSFSCNCPQKK